MIVVSNTSPITNLAAVGQLYLLQALYDNIVIPEAVYRELTSFGANIPGATEVQTFEWIQVQTISDNTQVDAFLQKELHLGESEAIVLALELQADLLLIDEEIGRTVAVQQRLRLTGILGVLIEAKQQSVIPLVKPILDDLINTAGFWVGERLYDRILQRAGEYH